MDAERREFARDGFGEDALRRLGRREPGKSRAAAFGRRIAGDEDRAALRLHPLGAPARHMIERHHVDVEIGLEHRRLDIEEGSDRSEEHTSELQSLMRISYAVFCLKKKKKT